MTTTATAMSPKAGLVALFAVVMGAALPAAPDAAAQGSAASDRAALEAIYDATGGASWTDDTNWKTAAPLGEWSGVTTDADGRVTWLSLPGNGLSGRLPNAVGDLALLRGLNLGERWDSGGWHENALTGSIPPALGKLTNLDFLHLGANELTGPTPGALGNLVNLTRLYLYDNALTGPVPEWLRNLVNLDRLYLGDNALTGTVPAWLGDLTKLSDLDLNRNELTGPIPSELGNLANLESLSLYANGLTGPVPAWLGNLANLSGLYLGRNDLTGPIPPGLASLENLRSLFLDSNGLTGPIPRGLGNLANLERLDFSANDLSGPIPAELGGLENLRSLYLYYNGLSGPIPSELGDLANLERLDLENNGLSGPIPSELGDLANLQSLDLSTNPVTGPLPQRLTGLSRLTRLDIRFTGACVPHDAAFQAWLAAIDFRGELCNRPPEAVDAIPAQTLTESGPALALSLEPHFTDPDGDALTHAATSSRGGTVAALVSGDTLWLAPGTPGTAMVTVTASDPDGLSATQTVAVTTTASAGAQNDREALEVFYDATGGPSWTNGANWKTSAPLGEWHGVTTDDTGRVTGLDLDNNGLTGPIPLALEDLANLERLHLARNDLVGSIPTWLGGLAGLRGLRLSGNEFTGPIPDSLAALVNLEWLYLNSNRLTGSVPVWLGNLSGLRWLYLNGNRLTGPIPNGLRRLADLHTLGLGRNDLTGPVPSWLGDLTELRHLDLAGTALTGPIPDELGNLVNLERLNLDYAWGVSGPLPAGLRQSNLERLRLFATRACTPAAWREWLETIDFEGRACEAAPVTIDVAVVYTPAAREEAGGTAAIEAVIDLMVAETNQAYEAGGLQHRLALAATSEVRYTEAGDGRDLERLADPSDGYMDEVHAMRDRTGADLVHLVFKHEGHPFGGLAFLPGAFGLTCQHCGGRTFAHELGHNMGLSHDRYQTGGGRISHPAYGYVNQHGLAAGATRSSRWRTIMAYPDQCTDAHTSCSAPLRFSNPRRSYNGDPLGIAFGDGGSGVTGPADAVAVLDATGPVVADWRDHVPRPNRPPRAFGALPDRTLAQDAVVETDVSSAFLDPDGDTLTYTVSSSAPQVVAVGASGPRVTMTAMAGGTAMVRVTATDPGGLSADQAFSVTVIAPTRNRAPQPVGRLAALTLMVDGEAATVDVSGAFRDPDGDALTYGATSSAPSVASVAVVGSMVTVTPVVAGPAMVTVTATDTGGLSASQVFPVTVSATRNRPPQPMGRLAALTLMVDGEAATVDVSGAFRDPDGDALTYGATSSAPSVASVAVAGSTVTVRPVAAGSAMATVTATDAGGLSASQVFPVTVSATRNRPPEPVGGLAALTLMVDGEAATVDVSGAFRDPDGDALSYGATSSAPSVASVAVVGSTVTVRPVAAGSTVVTVTATDAGGSDTTAEQALAVRVQQPFTDEPIVPGVTPIKAIHFTELRTRIDALRRSAGLGSLAWTDPILTAGVTPVRLVHLLEMRSALAAAFAASGRQTPAWTDPAPSAGTIPIRAVHLTELRAAVVALERGE